MSKSDMELAEAFFHSKEFLDALDWLENHDTETIVTILASLIQEVRNETLEAAAGVAEQTVVQKPICSTREQHRGRGKVMPSLTRQAISQEIRALKSQTQDSKEGDK